MIKTKFEQPKTATIVVRVLEQDKLFFKEYAENNGYKMSEFIRLAMDEKIAEMERLKRVENRG